MYDFNPHIYWWTWLGWSLAGTKISDLITAECMCVSWFCKPEGLNGLPLDVLGGGSNWLCLPLLLPSHDEVCPEGGCQVTSDPTEWLLPWPQDALMTSWITVAHLGSDTSVSCWGHRGRRQGRGRTRSETQTLTGFGYSSFGDPGGWLFSNVVNQNFVRAALNHPQTAFLSFILLWLHYGGVSDCSRNSLLT